MRELVIDLDGYEPEGAGLRRFVDLRRARRGEGAGDEPPELEPALRVLGAGESFARAALASLLTGTDATAPAAFLSTVQALAQAGAPVEEHALLERFLGALVADGPVALRVPDPDALPSFLRAMFRDAAERVEGVTFVEGEGSVDASDAPLAPALEGAGGRAGRLRALLELGAMCGRDLPVGPALRALGATGDEADELVDLIDEHLCPDVFVDLAYTHPSFVGTAVYACVDPAVQAALVAGVGSEARALARRLFELLEESTPVLTRGVAGALLSLARHADDAERVERLEKTLAWWFEGPRLGVLQQEVGASGASPELVWAVAHGTQGWLPQRRLVVLQAYAGAFESGLPDRAGAFHLLRGELCLATGNLAPAQADAKKAADQLRAAHGEGAEFADALTLHARVANAAGNPAEAARAAATAAGKLAERRGARHRSTHAAKLTLGQALIRLGRAPEALAVQGEVLAEQQQSEGAALDALRTRYELAMTRCVMKDLSGGLAEMNEVHQGFRAALGELHPDALACLGNVWQLLASVKQTDEALECADEHVELSTRLRGEAHPLTLEVRSKRAALLAGLGRRDESLGERRGMLVLCERSYGVESPPAAGAKIELATALRTGGGEEDVAEARGLEVEVLQGFEQVIDAGPERHLEATARLDGLLRARWAKPSFEKLRELVRSREEALQPLIQGPMGAPWKRLLEAQ